MTNEEDKIELRSEEFQEVLGNVPPWILRWGITVLAFVFVILLVGSAFIKYPDVIPARIVLTASVLSANVDSLTLANNGLQVGNRQTGYSSVPTDYVHVTGKASLPIARSGKVEIGQKVNIRLENFPENEFGILRGVVQTSLAPAQLNDVVYYTVEISLPNKLMTTYNKELLYLPNMQGEADIITEDISLLERFFLPIKKILY